MPNILANIAKMDSATTGTGTLTLGAAVTGYLSFANAGVTNSQVVTYAIEDYDVSGNIIAREVGAGTYSSTGPTLTRDTVYSSTNAGAKINCSGLQYVFVSLAKEDLATFGVLSAVNTWTANNYFTTGNVGIGTASPVSRLDLGSIVHGTASTGVTAAFWNSAGNVFGLGVSSGQLNYIAGTTTQNSHVWHTNAAERVRIDSAGNVGIGTSSPGSQLHVVSATNFQPQIIADHVAGAGTGAAYFVLDRARGTPSARTAVVSGDTLGTLMARGYDGSAQQNSAWLAFDVDGTVSAGNVPTGISVYVTPQGASTRLSTHFDASGNVGIGTLTPSSKLSVEEGGVRLDISPFGGATGYVGTQSNHPLGIITNNAEAIRVTTDSRIGIGTTNPSGFDAKLAVFNGNIALTTTTNRLYLYYASATNHAYLSAAAGGEILFANGTSSPVEKMRLDTSGNLGVGVTPTFRFVAGNSSTDGGWLYSSGGESYLGLGGFSGAGDGAFRLTYDRSNGNITLSGGSRDTPTPRMRIDNSGNVGIGTTSPDANAKLDVAGTIRISTGGIDPGTGAAMYLVGSGSFQTVIGGPVLAVHTGANNARTERMRVHASGGVSIGNTTDPGAGITAVNATLRINRFNTSNEGGELQFCRASDDTVGWYIDLVGTGTGTDPTTMRWIDNKAATPVSRLELNSRGQLTITNDLGPASTDTTAVGFRGSPHNDQSGTTYTFAVTDAGRAVMYKGTGVSTWTVPLSTTTDFPIGTMIIVDNSHYGSGGAASAVVVGGATGVGIRTTGTEELTTGSANRKQVNRGNILTLRKLANRSVTQSVTSVTNATLIATMTTPVAHGYIVGDFIEVAGANQAAYNGTHRVLTVGTTTTLTYAMATNPGASATGTVTVRRADLWNATGNYFNVA